MLFRNNRKFICRLGGRIRTALVVTNLSMLRVLAGLAVRSARWPIQTLVFTTVLALVVYFSLVGVTVKSYGSPLARSFKVSGSDEWGPVTSVPSGEPQYVGATLFFENKSGVQNARDFVFTHLPSGTLASGIEDEGPVGVLMQSSQFHDFIPAVSQFTTGNKTWELQPSYNWIVWASWSFRRLMDLVRITPEFDLIIVGLAYLAMYYVFLAFFKDMWKLGSRIYLFTSAIIGSTFSFMIAYAITTMMGINVPGRTLMQGLPFLVVIIGFELKATLARVSFKFFRENVDPELCVAKVISERGQTLFRDTFFELLFLIPGSFLPVPKLSQFSLLSAIILIVDMILTCTFFAANLSIKLTMVKVKRNEVIRRALEEDGVSEAAAEQYADEATRTNAQDLAAPSSSGVRTLFRAVIMSSAIIINYCNLWRFPYTLTSGFNDLRQESDIASFINNLPTEGYLTVLPPLRFVPIWEDTIVRRFWTFAKTEPLISKLLVTAFAVSLGLNGYLMNATRKQTATVRLVERRIPLLVESAFDPGASRKDAAVADPDIEQHKGVIDGPCRSLEDCEAIMNGGLTAKLTDAELVNLGVSGKLPLYALEKQLGDTTRAVVVRRSIVSRLSSTKTLEKSKLPYKDYDYDRVLGACCENVIGYLPLPIGVAGPILVDGEPTYLPMATTEGVLVASTMRGCKAINGGGGVTTEILQDGMTRGPCVSFPSLPRAASAKRWLDSEEGQKAMKRSFESTSRFAKLISVKTAEAGTLLYIRFMAQTGDAMGMNMISKGVERALQYMVESCGYEDMSIVSISGNYCTDKKPTALNWIEGRGKSLVAEAIVPAKLVRTVLKTTVDDLIELNHAKNLVGSALAGTIGGFNAHAANLVAAMFIATGQDPAQVVEGSNCMTLMANVDGDLQISVTMPSLEVGTIGGGTILEPQAAVLDILGVKGPAEKPGENAQKLARIIASAVLAGELSLCSALAAGHLVKSHMAHNRSKQN